MLKFTPVSSALTALIVATALSGCGGSGVEPVSSTLTPTAAVTTTDAVAEAAAAAEKAAAAEATQAAEVTAAAAATKAAKEAAAAEAAKVANAQAASATKAASEVFIMPSLVGENLQLAQDKLQALGSFVLDQEDAAGLSRIQVNDSNWQVCKQDPAPGKKVPVETLVLLSSVKLAEQCP